MSASEGIKMNEFLLPLPENQQALLIKNESAGIVLDNCIVDVFISLVIERFKPKKRNTDIRNQTKQSIHSAKGTHQTESSSSQILAK